MKVWFVSDLHFSHVNILYFKPKRRETAGITLEELRGTMKEHPMAPGVYLTEKSGLSKEELIEKHDKWLINRWNEQVQRGDVVYILGDFCLGNSIRTERILSQLHGKKFLIRGNHDKSCNGLERYFVGVYDIKEAKFDHGQFPFIKDGETFCVEMCHYPMVTWNRRPHGTVNLHGHVHGTLDQQNKDSKELRLDVGLDGAMANYHLISLEDIYSYFREIVDNAGCATFQDYAEKLMAEQGYRI